MLATCFRFTLFLIPAGAVVLALFIFMAKLAGLGTIAPMEKQADIHVDFSRIKLDSQVQDLQRKKPEPPEPEPQQPQPQTFDNLELTTEIQPVALDIPAPDISVRPELTSSFKIPPMKASLNVDAINPIVNPDPVYPSRAKRLNLEGHVKVKYRVGKDGKVINKSIKVIESNPPGVFDIASIRAIARWRFEPLIVDGEAIEFDKINQLEFELE